MTDLLPCPFCGGESEEDAGGCSEYYGHEHQDFWISCKGCGATVQIVTAQKKDGSVANGFDFACSCCNDTSAEVRARWNARYHSQQSVMVPRELLVLAYQAVHTLAGFGIDGYTEKECLELRVMLGGAG